jgi:hypothetical protein
MPILACLTMLEGAIHDINLYPSRELLARICVGVRGVIHCGAGALLKEISMAGLPIRQDYSPSDLRMRASREKDCRAALRLLAIANALEGMTRTEAARLAGMERQALPDAIRRFNAEGPDGLHDRPRTGRPEQLSPGQQAALKAHILRGVNAV